MCEFPHCLLHALNKKYLLQLSNLCMDLFFLSNLFLRGHIRYIHIGIQLETFDLEPNPLATLWLILQSGLRMHKLYFCSMKLNLKMHCSG